MITRLSDHFSLEELTASQTAARGGLDNIPRGQALVNLTATAEHMEAVRALLGNRVISVSSGYRSPAVNAAVGGAKTSAHVQGYAVDFNCRSFGSPAKVAEFLKDKLPYDQLIFEYGEWVHISFAPKMRGQELTIDRLGTRPGIVPIR
jgi:hypothetical protein